MTALKIRTPLNRPQKHILFPVLTLPVSLRDISEFYRQIPINMPKQ